MEQCEIITYLYFHFGMKLNPITTLVLLLIVMSGQALTAAVDWPEPVIKEVASGFIRPVDIQSPPNGSNDLYILEKAGRIRILLGGQDLQTEVFLDIDERVEGGTSEFSEQGLLGLAFDPDFDSNGYFFLNYTHEKATGGTETRISRFSTVVGNDRLAEADSELVLLTVDQPFSNHNGGQLQFGPDGFLYIGLGDGGAGGDPMNNAQDPQSLLGKMLRLNVKVDDFPADNERNYAIPASNPFVDDESVRDEIWALGLRNPWRFSFDGLTGDLYIADVGQNEREEVDFQPATSGGGENYGWRVFEGIQAFEDSLGLGPGSLREPVWDVGHTGGNCSITGGYVYRGNQYPRMSGIYFYADWCSGRIWGLTMDEGEWVFAELADTDFSFVSFGQDAQGNLYFADQSAGRVFKITDSVGIDVRDNWAGFPVINNPPGWANTGDWMGWVQVDFAPWIFNDSLQQWLFIEEEDITENGSWVFMPRP